MAKFLWQSWSRRVLSKPTRSSLWLQSLEDRTTPTASFAAPSNFGVGSFPEDVAIGDFNRDGNAGSDRLGVMLGPGTGAFGAVTFYTVGDLPVHVAVADFNLDGRLDLISTNQNSGTISLLIGTGGGSFGTATHFPVGVTPNGVAVADLNLDGKPDIVVTSGLSNDLRIRLGKANNLPTAPTDSNAAVNSVPESAANGTIVGITAGSTDADGHSITYTLADNASGRFAINTTTGIVTVANGGLLDYESATGHAITVQASDGLGGTATTTFTIGVSNIAPPADGSEPRRQQRCRRCRIWQPGRHHGDLDGPQRGDAHLLADRQCRRPLRHCPGHGRRAGHQPRPAQLRIRLEPHDHRLGHQRLRQQRHEHLHDRRR